MAISKAHKIAFKLDAKLGNGFGRTFDEAENRFSRIGDKLTSVGKGLTLGVTTPLVALGAAAVRVGAEFESSMGAIQSRTGMAASEAEELGVAFRQLAVSGDYGAFGARQVADAFANVAVAGQNVEHATEIMRTSMVLATATGKELSGVAYFLGSYLEKVGKDATYAERYINIFAATNQKTNIGLATLQEYLFRANVTLQATNISGTEASAMFGRLYQAGVQGAQAYSGVEAATRALLRAEGDHIQVLRDLGIERYDQNGQLRDGIPFLMDVANALSELEGSTLDYKIGILGATDSGRAFLGGMVDIRGTLPYTIDGLYEAANAAYGTGTAFEMAAIQQDGMAESAARIRASLEEIKLQVADQLMPHVQRFVDAIGGLVNRFANLDEGTQRTVIRLAMVAAAAGPVLMVTGKLVKTVGAAHKAYTTFKSTLIAVKTVTALASKAEAAKTAATITGTKATELANIATAARKAAKAAEIKALKAAEKADMLRATAGATSAKTMAAVAQAEHLRTVAITKAGVATQTSAAAEKSHTIASKVNTAALKHNTAVTKASTLANSKLGKSYTLLLKAQATSAAALKAKSVALAATATGSGVLALGTKALSVAFKVMSIAIMKIPVFGWIVAGITAVIAIGAVLINLFRSVGEEYKTTGEAAERLSERQEALAQSSANVVETFTHEVRMLEARAEQYEHLTGCIDHATQMYNLHRNEINRVSHEYTELGLGLEDTRNKISAIEAKLGDGSNRRRRDTRALNDALESLRETENAYVAAMESNRLMQADLANGIEVHADVLADLERQQQEAAAAMAVATAEMEGQMRIAEEWERAQSQALDRMNAAFENYKRLTTNAFSTVTENVALSVSDMTSNLLQNAAAVEEWSINLAYLTERGLDEGLIEQLRQAGPEAAATVRELVNASYYELEALNSAFEESTQVAVESMQRNLDPHGVADSAYELIDVVATTILENQAMENALIDLVNAGFEAFSDTIDYVGFDSVGYGMALGAAEGVYTGEGALYQAGVFIAETVFAGTRDAAMINSPSRLFMGAGEYMGDGLAVGMYSKYDEMIKVSEDIVHGIADTMYAKAGVVEKACKNISKIMAKNLHVKAPGFDSAGYGMALGAVEGIETSTEAASKISNVIPFPGASSAYSAQASFSRYNYLSDAGDSTSSTPKPADAIQRMGDVAAYHSNSYSFEYHATPITINGSGQSTEELKAMIKQLLNDDQSAFEARVKRIMEDDNYRNRRLANA